MLLNEYVHECIILVPTRTADGEGGWVTTWAEGATFTNHRALDSSSEARRAEQQGLSPSYSNLVDQGVEIKYGDYFRDTVDGLTYRVTSDPGQKQTPGSASFALKYFNCVREDLPT